MAMVDDDARLEALANDLDRRGLRAPMLLLLEIIRPVWFLCGQAFLVFEPLMAPLLGNRQSQFAQLLTDEETYDRLLDLVGSKGVVVSLADAGTGERREALVGRDEENR